MGLPEWLCISLLRGVLSSTCSSFNHTLPMSLLQELFLMIAYSICCLYNKSTVWTGTVTHGSLFSRFVTEPTDTSRLRNTAWLISLVVGAVRRSRFTDAQKLVVKPRHITSNNLVSTYNRMQLSDEIMKLTGMSLNEMSREPEECVPRERVSSMSPPTD